MLSHISVRYRLLALTGLGLLAMVLGTAGSLYVIRDTIMSEHKNKVQELVVTAHSVIASYGQRAAAGEMTEEQAKQEAMSTIRALRYGENDYFWINDMVPRMVMHPMKPELDGKPLSDVKDPTGKLLFKAYVDTVARQQEGFVDYLWPKPGHDEPVRKLSYVKGYAPWKWVVGSGVYVDNVDALVMNTAIKFGAGVALAAAIILLFTTSIVRAILRSVSRTKGHLDGMKAGDFSHPIDVHGRDEFAEMLQSLAQMKDRLCSVIRDIKSAASAVDSRSSEISQGNSDLSSRTEEQASSLEETASSMEEMTGTVKQNADNAAQANQLASSAREQAERGGLVVGRAVESMAEINASSKKIADIIGVIDEIAFQTNLLALNAAVEAARAGEQGRGFAVVAGEVRSLAQRSAEAAKEIKELITDSVAKVEDGTKLVDESGQTLEQIVNSVKKVSDIVAEIAAASQEQSAGIEQVNQAIMQMDDVTQQNAALVEEAAAASQALGDQAAHLKQMMAFFDVGDGRTAQVSAAEPKTDSSLNVERRSASRPWTPPSNAGATEPKSRSGAEPARLTPRKVSGGGGGNDAEWEEF